MSSYVESISSTYLPQLLLDITAHSCPGHRHGCTKISSTTTTKIFNIIPSHSVVAGIFPAMKKSYYIPSRVVVAYLFLVTPKI